MIHCLDGLIVRKRIEELVISCGGVGFRVAVPSGVYAATGNEGDKVFLFTYMSVKEDALDLYGFLSEEDLDCFRMLIGVSGVGPRAGLSILSLYTAEKVALAIASGDHKAFSACSGIGPKLAQRITLELKDKVSALGSADAVSVVSVKGDAGSKQEAMAALVSLGFSTSEAAAAVAKLPGDIPVEEIVSLSLKSLARS